MTATWPAGSVLLGDQAPDLVVAEEAAQAVELGIRVGRLPAGRRE
jgi:hypothetical protein